MKTFLIAVDTSGLYDHEVRKKDVLETLNNLCSDVIVTLVTFDARGIVHHNVNEFMNETHTHFMETPKYRPILELLDDYDSQQLFTSYVNMDVLFEEMRNYSVETFGFDVE